VWLKGAEMNTIELTGPALDWAVAKAMKLEIIVGGSKTLYLILNDTPHEFAPSQCWAQGGSLLNQHKISRTIDHSGLWIAYAGYNLNDEQRHMQCDKSELVAGLRCFVASKLGEEINIPEALK